jgi:SAM-dependent methyltransferase
MKCRGIESIADLGCGDFQVGQRITSRCDVKYVGVDIVQAMVARNQISFGNDRISFLCADLAVDGLPDADLCLIRQVLQHLSNAEIHAVLENISHYKYALISEHVPKRPKSFNRDKPHGPDVRAYCGSGVYLERTPFSRDITVAWEDELDQDSLLRTVLMQRRHRGQGER